MSPENRFTFSASCSSVGQDLEYALPSRAAAEILLLDGLLGLHGGIERRLGAEFAEQPVRFLSGAAFVLVKHGFQASERSMPTAMQLPMTRTAPAIAVIDRLSPDSANKSVEAIGVR